MDRLVYVIQILLFLVLAECNDERLLVSLDDGVIRGHYKTSFGGRTYMAFEGLPYAKPPVQKLRYREPEPVEPWLGILDATNLPAMCLQLDYTTNGTMGQEDCLYLNVYIPRDEIDPEEKLDVIVHIHGGAFMLGSGSMVGPKYLMDRDVIFINFNYRLGALGFFSTGDGVFHGNFGLKDQTYALEWVQANIGKFGGNRDSVTLTGLSAGGASVHLHYFIDYSKGLFHRGFAQSGVALNPWVVRQNPWINAKIVATEVGCFDENIKVIYRCLKQRPALQIIEGVRKTYKGSLLPLVPFGPATEFYFQLAFLLAMPYLQLASKHVTDLPLLISVTSDEGLPATLFYDKLDELNDNWNYWLPIMLDYQDYDEEKKNKVSAKIRDFYFREQPITKENFNILVKLCSQRMFHLGAEKAAKMQAEVTNSSVYFLMMGYAGEGENFAPGLNKVDIGTAHGMDAKFYYDTEFAPLDINNEREVKMKDILIDMLVSYAKTGKPEVPDIDFQPVPKSGNLKYLSVIGPDNISMKSIKRLGPHEFWRSLELREEENAFTITNNTIEIK